jgi:hypothetical protein
MAYSDKVIDHYNNPRNVGALPKKTRNGNRAGRSAECGDVMKLQIKVNESGVIEDAKFKHSAAGALSQARVWRRVGKGQDAHGSVGDQEYGYRKNLAFLQ